MFMQSQSLTLSAEVSPYPRICQFCQSRVGVASCLLHILEDALPGQVSLDLLHFMHSTSIIAEAKAMTFSQKKYFNDRTILLQFP